MGLNGNIFPRHKRLVPMKLTNICLINLLFSLEMVGIRRSIALGSEPKRGPIEFLTPPRYAPPPRAPDDPKESQETFKKVKNRKSLERARREQPFRPQPHPWHQKIRENLQEDLNHGRERDYLIELSFTAPYTLTTGAKSGYSQNPSQLFEFYWRRGDSKSDGNFGLFLGMRLAAFSGNGFYRKEPGSFGLLYFGPALGFGRLNQGEQYSGRNSTQQEDSMLDPSEGFLWSFGISATHRQGNSDTTPQ